MESHFLNLSNNNNGSTEFISRDFLQLDVSLTAHVEVTRCGLRLLNLNSEKTKHR